MSECHDLFGLIGAVVDGRYRVDAVVGEGGFGVVYRGYHVNFRQPIAIKVLKAPGHFTPTAREQFVDKFREEGQMLSQLSDAPGVVRVFDFGVVSSASMGPAPYLVLEWLDGETLEAFLERRRTTREGPLGVADAVAMLAPVIDAVAYAHSRKIAHRDIKPANVFLVNTPRGIALKVLDFGIGKAMQEGENANFAATGTKSAFHAFSPMYGAPEQFFSKRFGATGPWTDVHALGLVLVETITGRTALDGDDAAEFLVSATNAVRPTPRARGLALPDPLEAVFQRALALAPPDRYGDAQQLLDGLRGAMAQVGLALPAAPMSAYGHLAQLPAGLTAPRGPLASAPDERVSSPAVGTEAWLAQQSAPPPPGATPPMAAHASAAAGSGLAATTPTWESAAGTEPGPHRGVVPAATGHADVARPATPVPPEVRRVSAPGGSPAEAAPPRRALWPWAIALVVLGGGGAMAGILASQSGAGGGAPDSSGSGSTNSAVVDPDKEEVEFGREMAIGGDVFGAGLLSEAERSGMWHYRITRRGGRATSVARIRPNGEAATELRITHADDGARTLRNVDDFGVEASVQTITADGLAMIRLRSGVVSADGCYRKKLVYNGHGHVVESTCLSPTGVPIADEGGCDQRRASWDEHHQKTEERCFGLDAAGKEARPITDKGGAHLGRYRYDDGRLVSERFFDVMGGAVERVTDGCFGMKIGHDPAGNQAEITCIDATGAPRAVRGSQVAMARTQFDGNGCAIDTRFFDVAGKPATYGTMAAQLAKVDAKCRVLRSEQRELGGKLVAAPGDHVAARESEYDERGELVAERCFGSDDRPIGCSDDDRAQGTEVRYERDELGRSTSERHFGPDDKPTRQSDSYPHETRHTYGDEGREITRAFFDERGQPVGALGGVARFAYRYDALGAEVSQSFFDAEGRPMASSVGCHELRHEYDDQHLLTAIDCRDTKGELTVASTMSFANVSWPAGSARMAVLHGEHIVNVYSGPEGREIKREDCSDETKPCYR